MKHKELKDTMNQLSFSHDGKKILFDRCRGGDCQIQVYDLETGELSAYQSPSGERWTMARQSYDGQKIVLSTIPMGEKYLDLSNMQIAVMDPDGKNIKKITTGYGAKIYPTFSHSGKKVLYARAAYIRKKGGTPAAQFDAWEVDLETGKETRLTYFKFFGMSHLAYFPDDERFIFYGSFPEAYPGIKDRDQKALLQMQRELAKRKMSFAGIQVMRGKEMLPQLYSFADGILPSNPLLSKDGRRLLFERHGGEYYLYSPDGKHRRISGGGSINSAAISPDGELLGINYSLTVQIFKVQDRSQYRVIVLPKAISYFPNWDQDFIKNKEKIRVVPELPSRIINR